MVVNRKVVLAKRPEGQLLESDFKVVEEELADPNDGEVLLQVEHLSVDAFIRTTLDGPKGLHGTIDLNTELQRLGLVE